MTTSYISDTTQGAVLMGSRLYLFKDSKVYIIILNNRGYLQHVCQAVGLLLNILHNHFTDLEKGVPTCNYYCRVGTQGFDITAISNAISQVLSK